MNRKEFIIKSIVINGKPISRVIVDDHVKKHKSITDDLILDLVRLLDSTDNIPDDVNEGFEYFVNLLVLDSKQY